MDAEAKEKILVLLNHLENVIDDANWEKISPTVWNAVSELCGE